MRYPDYLVHYNPNHDPKTGRFDFKLGARVNALGEVVDRKGNVNTDVKRYMYTNYKHYKNHPGGYKEVGRNRSRIVQNLAYDAVTKRSGYEAAKMLNKTDPETMTDKKLREFKKQYEDSINFIKKYINSDIKERSAVDENGVEYVTIHFDDPLTKKNMFSKASTAGIWNIYSDGKINWNAGKIDDPSVARDKLALQEGYASWDDVPEDHWLKRD